MDFLETARPVFFADLLPTGREIEKRIQGIKFTRPANDGTRAAAEKQQLLAESKIIFVVPKGVDAIPPHVFEILHADAREVGHPDIQNSARPQNAMELQQESMHALAFDMLKHVIGQNIIHSISLQRQDGVTGMDQNIWPATRLPFLFLRHIQIDPALAVIVAATEIEAFNQMFIPFRSPGPKPEKEEVPDRISGLGEWAAFCMVSVGGFSVVRDRCCMEK